MSATHSNLVTDDSKARAAFTMVALLAEAQGSSAKSLAAVRIESPEKCWTVRYNSSKKYKAKE